MALTQRPVEFFAVVKDRGANTARVTYKSSIDNNTDAEAELTAFIAAFSALTEAKVIKAGYSWVQEETDQTVGTGNGEVEKKAEISVALVQTTPPAPGQTRFGQVTIPAPVPGIFQAASGPLYNVIDPADTALQTFLALFTEDLANGNLTLSDYQVADNPATLGNVIGKRITKASRKG